jgi:cytidine deaminase
MDHALYDAAVSLIERRLPSADWATAAAIRLDDGSIKVGICLDNFNSAASLCAEVGPICEAFTNDQKVIASLCVNRSKERQHDLVLAPCGLCQERLALWGPSVEVGVPDVEVPGGWSSRRLADINPYYWATVFFDDAHWPTAAEHSD